MTTNDTDSLKNDWPKPSDFRQSIRLEFTLYMSAVAIAMMLVTGYIVSELYVNTVTRGIVDKMLAQARSYSGPAAKLIIGSSAPDALLLSNTCSQLANANPDVYWAGISGRDGVFIAHTNMKQVISSQSSVPLQTEEFADLTREGEGIQLAEDTIYISVPVVENGILVGNLSIATSSESVKRARRDSIRLILFITLAVISIGVPITWVVLHRKLRPLGAIVDSLKNADLEDLQFDVKLKQRNEFAYLAESLQTMGNRLSIARRELIEKQRIAQELEIARDIQDSILPRTFPESASFSIAGTYRSALEVGGDYYDFIRFDNSHLGLLVADVSGKSLPGMLVMLMTRDIVKRVASTYRPPREILSDVNGELLGSIRKGMFVTMFLGVLSTETGEMEFASAGHNPVLHYSSASGKAQFIKTKGYPLGMMPRTAFEERLEQSQILLQCDDLVLQYTDGVNEALNPSEEEYGLDRFARFIESQSNVGPSELVENFLTAHQQFVGDARQYDDITLLAVKWLTLITDKNNIQSETFTYARNQD
jgi:serine phosphatase RsbU (regulator of sigma subunit)